MNFLEGRPVNTRAQRTGKPYARLLLLSGFTVPLLLKPKLPALPEPTAFGEALQEYPLLPTLSNAPDELLRSPDVETDRNRLLN